MPNAAIQWKGEQPVFDTINLAALAVGGTFFQVPRGGAIGAAVKNARHTNLVLAGQLESNVFFTCDSFSMHVVQSALAGAIPTAVDIRSVYSGNIRFIKTANEWLTLPAQSIPAGGADFVLVSNIAPAATEFYLAKGVQANQNVYRLREPIDLEGGMTFSVILENCDAIVAPVHVCFMLWGMMTKFVK